MEQQPYNYASYELCLISEIVDAADALASGWVFRGQSDASWPITSSLEREAERQQERDRAAFEATTLKQIKLVPHLVAKSAAARPEDDFSWLALLQHHGCKTRLVDFTRSFYVALYFAVRDCPDSDAAIWCIATGAMDARMAALCQRADFTISEEEIPDNLTTGLGLTEKKEPVKRISTLHELTHEAVRGNVIKICVPQSQHRSTLFHLRRMNITDATLFPGLDGFARSLNYFAMGVE